MSTPAGPYPFLPEQYLFFVFEKDGHEIQVSYPHLNVSGVDGSSDLLVSQLDNAISVHRATHVGIGVKEMEALAAHLGCRLIDMRAFDFFSGTLYWRATLLLEVGHKAAEQRAELLRLRDGKEPPPGDPAWPEWVEFTLTAASCANGARLLGYCSLEAFVNEVTSVNFAEMFESQEGVMHRGWVFTTLSQILGRVGIRLGSRALPWRSTPAKLAQLLKKLGISRKTDWYRRIAHEPGVRKSLEHHKPAGVVSDGKALDSVTPSERDDIVSAEQFLGAVAGAFDAVFAAYGVATPATHKPWGEGARAL